MKLPVNKLTFDVFQHETEDKSKIFLGLQQLFQLELHDSLEKMVTTETITGYHENVILKYRLELSKGKETQNMFLYMMTNILRSVSFYDLLERITEEGELFIRLNKQELIKGSFVIDSSSDVYKIVIKFLFFNKNINKINEIYEYLKSLPLE